MSTWTPEDFCDRPSHDWPAELRNLQDAAAQAASSYRVIADLALFLDASDHKGRAELRAIEDAAYSAWMLLEQRGLKLLAVWQADQALADGLGALADDIERMERQAAERAAMSHDQAPEYRDGSADAAAEWERQNEARGPWAYAQDVEDDAQERRERAAGYQVHITDYDD